MDFFIIYFNTDEGPFNLVVTMKGSFFASGGSFRKGLNLVFPLFPTL